MIDREQTRKEKARINLASSVHTLAYDVAVGNRLNVNLGQADTLQLTQDVIKALQNSKNPGSFTLFLTALDRVLVVMRKGDLANEDEISLADTLANSISIIISMQARMRT